MSNVMATAANTIPPFYDSVPNFVFARRNLDSVVFP